MRTEPDDDAFERLADELATRQAWEILAFEDQLASALYALDTRGHARAARARGDWFLYVRCAAISSGSSIYQQILADPKELRRFARREAEPLLYVAMKAYERSTGDAWTHESPVSTPRLGRSPIQARSPASTYVGVNAWAASFTSTNMPRDLGGRGFRQGQGQAGRARA